MPAKKVTAKKITPRKTTAKTVSARKTTARKSTAKATAKKVPAKRATTRASKTVAKRTPIKKTTAKPRQGSPASGRSPAKKGRVSASNVAVRPGDLIVIDSAQVGSPAREGEVLQVIQGEVSVSYRVQWADGHETLISPMSGTARIIKASGRA